jgi:hypothetical protein
VGDFDERIGVLIERIGYGDVEGMVEVNQSYAHRQHEHLEYHHPRGGQAMYLTAPLTERWPGYLEKLAAAALDGDLSETMAECMEDLSGQVAVRAPIEDGELRGSGHPTVRKGGAVVYDRPPLVPRTQS